MSWWLDDGQCGTCTYCSMDMDLDPFCVHPVVLAQHPIGLNVNAAIRDYCGEDLTLRIADPRRCKKS